MRIDQRPLSHFPCHFPLTSELARRCAVADLLADLAEDALGRRVVLLREVAARLTGVAGLSPPPTGGELLLLATLHLVFASLAHRYFALEHPGLAERLAGGGERRGALAAFTELLPPTAVLSGEQSAADYAAAAGGHDSVLVRELLLTALDLENPALVRFTPLFAAFPAWQERGCADLARALERQLAGAPPALGELPLPELLRQPLRACPDSLVGQLAYMREHWQGLLPAELVASLATAMEVHAAEQRSFPGGPGPAPVLTFAAPGLDEHYPEHEAYSADADWMPNVVLLAKMTHVWLHQLSTTYGREIVRLDQVPDAELDRLARWGFTGLWLIGVWERSPASREIKHRCGNTDAIASAYSLYDYAIAADLGGETALEELKERCRQRGIRLASDMVPNHTGLYSRWIVEHPDWFVQLDYPPYPGYRFTGPDLSPAPEVCLQLEDGYWDKSDAAVVFRHSDRRDGRVRYVYHGNDGTSTPWNDTAQLNYLLPEVREAVLQTILHVARQFPIIRFDAAMTLAKRHFQRLWFPQPGQGGVPSRAEQGMSRAAFDAAMPEEFWRQVVDRVGREVPGTLLLAEAFWLMEGYFVRTLGMHRVYNSAFMNMLKREENAKYRQTLKNVLEFDPAILQRFVNFMNNPDEKTAVEQFGKEGKYLGACLLLATMPGLPMFGHGQVEGYHEKYGMEYRRAYWDEPVDEHLVRLHEALVFPLLRRRWLFSGAERFVLFDFSGEHGVNEDVFAYSNRASGEKALVVYHNRFAETAGRVHTGVPRVVAGAGAGGPQERLDLVAALDLAVADDCYHAFRDVVDGRWYLRSSRTLAEEGLWLRLGAYQYHVFLDFRELRDDEYGSWGKLAVHLGGEGVADLEAELRQVQFPEICSRLAAVVAAGPGWPGEFPQTAVTAFLVALQEQLPELAPATLLAQAQQGWCEVTRLLASRPRRTLERQAMAEVALLLAGAAGTLLPAWLVVETLAAAGGETDPVSRFGLERAVARGLDAGGATTLPLTAAESAALWRLCLQHRGVVAAWAQEPQAALAGLLAEREVQRFLLVHESGAAWWFNRERWELLLGWLWLAALLPALASDTGQSAVALQPGYGMLVALRKRAAASGYRWEEFIAPSPEGEA